MLPHVTVGEVSVQGLRAIKGQGWDLNPLLLTTGGLRSCFVAVLVLMSRDLPGM